MFPDKLVLSPQTHGGTHTVLSPSPMTSPAREDLAEARREKQLTSLAIYQDLSQEGVSSLLPQVIKGKSERTGEGLQGRWTAPQTSSLQSAALQPGRAGCGVQGVGCGAGWGGGKSLAQVLARNAEHPTPQQRSLSGMGC